MIFRRGSSQEVDQGRKGLYLIGGISLIIIGILYFGGMIMSLIIGPPPSSSVIYFTAIAAHPIVAPVNFAAFIVAHFLLIPAIFALYFALKGVNRTAMLLATAFWGIFIALDIGVTEMSSMALVTLGHSYAAAMSEAQRSAYMAAANYALATLPLATFYSYVVSSIGLLITSILMLRGPFMRGVAFFGIGASVLGIIGGFYIFVPALAVLLSPCLIAFVLWLVFTGIRLCLLSRGR
jgi:hypothetical protein